jgi:UDPglucose 6-dehydrogenase
VKVSVFGLWHLGSVTSACLADCGHEVIGVDENFDVVEKLSSGMAPLFEPGLDQLVNQGIESEKLRFSIIEKEAFCGAEVVWITHDTPVDDNDVADVDYVINQVISIISFLSKNTLVLVSSQLPVGTIKRLEQFAIENQPQLNLQFACSPENLRLGQAIKVFNEPDRIIVGVRGQDSKSVLSKLLLPISDSIEWMSIESAEMTKHAINAFFATSIAFTNEIATICEVVGASAKDVERGLKSEIRIGPKAYVSPGKAFAGGTLARDIDFLSLAGANNNLMTHLLSSVRPSNDGHKNWVRQKLLHHFGSVQNKTIAIWGLTYKPGTDTLRRSLSVELCDWILLKGGKINVYDPVVENLPNHWNKGVKKYSSAIDTLIDSNVLIVATEWPELKKFAIDIVDSGDNNNLIVIDASGYLKDTLANVAKKYYVVGETILKENI